VTVFQPVSIMSVNLRLSDFQTGKGATWRKPF
jgi:hypothetical protein